MKREVKLGRASFVPSPAADVAPLLRRIEKLEKKLLSYGALNLVLVTVLRQRKLLDDEEVAAIFSAAQEILEKDGPKTFEELLAWAKEKR